MRGKSNWFPVLYLTCLLLFLELTLQIFYRATTGTYLYVRDKPPIWESDPYSGWTNRPNFSYRHITPEFTADIYTNSQGFRVSASHEQYEKNRPGDTFRILLVGPSFAFGWGVNFEATFGVQLQRMLTSRHFGDGLRIEIVNHGVPGLPAANELEWLKQLGMHYSPNLVIHFSYGSLEASSKPEKEVVVRNGSLIPATLSIKERVWGYAKNSATVFYAGIGMTLLSRATSSDTLAGNIEGAGRHMRNSQPFNLEDPVVADSILFYKELKNTVEASGAKLLIVYFPLAYVVHPQDRARWALQGLKNVDEQIQANRAFSSYLNGVGIKTLNLTDPFVQIARTSKVRLYYWLDVHWTEFGNAEAARLVTHALTEQHPNFVMENN